MYYVFSIMLGASSIRREVDRVKPMKELFGAVALSLKILVSRSKIFGRNASLWTVEITRRRRWWIHGDFARVERLSVRSIEDLSRIDGELPSMNWSRPSKRGKGEIWVLEYFGKTDKHSVCSSTSNNIRIQLKFCIWIFEVMERSVFDKKQTLK